MRILLAAHHELTPNAGVGGATLTLGDALRQLGHDVAVFGFAEAFGPSAPAGARMRFPWRFSAFLQRHAREFDVVDATTGDAWVWLRRRSQSPRVVTRAHGLEHVAHDALMQRARRREANVTWRYRFYSGGYRLWEVRRSIERAHGVVVLNSTDERFVHEHWHLPPERVHRSANGVAESLRARSTPSEAASRAVPLEVAFVGTWIPRKGTTVVTGAAAILSARGVPFRLSVLGSGLDEASVRNAFPVESRPFVRVRPSFEPAELPALVADCHVLLHPSWSEGFSLALAEGMACGLAPVSSLAGAAPELVRDGTSGALVPTGDAEAYADILTALASDRARLHRLRVGAIAAVRELSWTTIAGNLLRFYDSLTDVE